MTNYENHIPEKVMLQKLGILRSRDFSWASCGGGDGFPRASAGFPKSQGGINEHLRAVPRVGALYHVVLIEIRICVCV